MKYVVILGDGMADYPCEKLGGKTPLMVAKKPNIDELARHGEMGLCLTVPKSMSPGSDNANLSVMGYDPLKYYSGRSPLEAVSMGIELGDFDVTYRCNLVTLSNESNYEDKTMLDYSSGEITTAESTALIQDLAKVFNSEKIKLYAGISYRHCLRWTGSRAGVMSLTPPHDISDKKIADFLPKGGESAVLLDFMKRSEKILISHPINLARKARGLNMATSCWFWGEGTKPSLPDFEAKNGVRGAVISAVDLIKGIGVCAGLKVIQVEGATGNLNTNFQGKAKATIEVLKSGYDFVYVHMEAPDECGHHGDLAGKIESIERIDGVVGYIVDGLKKAGEPYSIMVMPDHATPISRKTHTKEPIPYMIYRSNAEREGGYSYDEENAKLSGVLIDPGYQLMERFLKDVSM